MEQLPANLKFFRKLAFDYNPGPIVDCTDDNGNPGFKASYDNCKCYIYETGNDESKKEARRKAYMQDYHKQRSKRVHGSVALAEAFFDNSTTPDMTKSEKSPDVALAPTSIKNPNANQTDSYSGGGPFGGSNPLGVGNNPMGDELNNSGTAVAASKNLNRENRMQETNDIIRTAQRVVREASWFDGSSLSIYTRLEQIQDVINELKMASSSPNLDTNSLGKLANTLIELETEREQLQKVASEYVDYDAEEYLQSLPGGTVASVYRTTDFGTADLGEDDGSLLYRTAKSIEREFQESDWINFVTAGAEVWVEDQHHGLLESQLATREAAVYYVEQKTLPILDVQKRAAIINNFVDNVEIVRRDKNTKSTLNDFDSARTAAKKTNFVVDNILGSTANWF